MLMNAVVYERMGWEVVGEVCSGRRSVFLTDTVYNCMVIIKSSGSGQLCIVLDSLQTTPPCCLPHPLKGPLPQPRQCHHTAGVPFHLLWPDHPLHLLLACSPGFPPQLTARPSLHSSTWHTDFCLQLQFLCCPRSAVISRNQFVLS